MIFMVLSLALVLGDVWVQASEKNLQITRVRGIPLEMKALYDPLKDFQCLDASIRLPFSYVNDDYCDCPDGSDEPGTAACSRGTFHCVNLMHSPLDIPSSRVNDGICDCCDGSDEYASGVSCPNTCEELGRAAREAAKRREEILSQGGQLRRSMVDQGKLKVSEAKEKVNELKGRVEDAKKERDELDQSRKDAEELERKMLDLEAEQKKERQKNKEEAEKVEIASYAEDDNQLAKMTFDTLDANEDGIVSYHEIMKQSEFDQDKNGEVSEGEAKFFLAYLEEVDADEFVSTAWPLIKPVWLLEERKSNIERPAPLKPDSSASDLSAEDKEDELLDHLEDGGHPEDDVEDDDGQELTPPEFPPVEKDATADGTDSSEPEERDPVVKSAVDAADKARSEYHQAERRYKDLEMELEKYEQISTGDFGDESEFAPLRGECFEMMEKEYVYKVCPFDRCSQRPKDGGAETALGRWARWEQRDGNRYATMKFEGGVGCWNGPARSAVVIMQCGLSNHLVSASEPSRCEYQFEFATPAACLAGMPTASQTGPNLAGEAEDTSDPEGDAEEHDEL
ncbi:glucosidase 2 subunit beta-like [Tropilaelaps mercedesae]|uniref:Glucosidase 2 subunit beta n=1 Tax=Tropilaelaps mercedesae TaxID=418985 RepID=A0A1V9X6C2_9ACAR|nr:glucosidase 2 subunit beta-like [Tropilaelaps mercedesae]